MDAVFADVRYALRSFRQAPAFFSLVIGILALGVGVSVSVFSLANSVRTVIHGVNRNAVIASVSTMELLLDQQKMQRRFQTWLIAVFSGIALGLAALGIFATMHYSVAARTNEIGIRMAVGADSSDIARLVLGKCSLLAIAGIGAGAFAAIWLTKGIAGMLYGVKPDDPLSYGLAAVVLFVVALLASYVPARRASHIDPIAALHEQ
jgi:ABC-type antimicrobial peptide transport system permease subunit